MIDLMNTNIEALMAQVTGSGDLVANYNQAVRDLQASQQQLRQDLVTKDYMTKTVLQVNDTNQRISSIEAMLEQYGQQATTLPDPPSRLSSTTVLGQQAAPPPRP